jgi:hypothetical protein
MSEIITIKPRLHFIFPNDSKFGVRNGWHSTKLQRTVSLCLNNLL